MKSILTAALVALTLLLPAAAQNRNLLQLSNTPLGAGIGEVTAAGNYAYVAHGGSGIDVVQIAGPGAPAYVTTFRPYAGLANIDISDLHVEGNILYAGNLVPNGSPTPHTGLFMYDLSANPLNPTLAGTITWGAGANHHLGASTSHFCINVSAGRTYAYLCSRISNAVEVFDVTNPALAEYKAGLRPPVSPYGSIQGVSVKNGVCAAAWLEGGFTLHDVSNIAASGIDWQLEQLVNTTSLLNYTKYASAYTYHTQFSDDGNFLLTTDGRTYIGCRSWDLRTITAPMIPLVHTAQFTSPTGARVHDLRVQGKYLYVSHYLDGCRVLELLPNGQFRDVAQFDTTPTVAGSGQWGVTSVRVYGETILVTDVNSGLYSLDLRDTIVIPKAEWKKTTNVLTIEATSTASPSVALSVSGFGPMTWNVSTGKYTLTIGGVIVKPATVTVSSDIGGAQSAIVIRR